jgi:hypothetical protein
LCNTELNNTGRQVVSAGIKLLIVGLFLKPISITATIFITAPVQKKPSKQDGFAQKNSPCLQY